MNTIFNPVTGDEEDVATLPVELQLLQRDDHPDFVSLKISEDSTEQIQAYQPTPDWPEMPKPRMPELPLPYPPKLPLPIKVCAAVSGRYRYQPIAKPGTFPLNLLSITVRVDVDRFLPQQRISIEARRLFPASSAHLIAEVTSDACLGLNHRRIKASVVYRHGSAALLPADQLVFEAKRGAVGLQYANYQLTVINAGVSKTYPLSFWSQYFDEVEFEVDQVAGTNNVTTSYQTHSHPNRSADLPNETLNLTNVFQRAGFNATLSPHPSTIPVTAAGANATWSDSEMHNAMVTYWQRFANKPQWAMWVLFAARHDSGHSLGGVMFDDIGANHRQGTAIFTNSFIQDVPAGETNAAAWRQRMVFWTAVHEMGHAFNLAHSWQKALGVPQGAPGNPWLPLANEPEARSFMNYPYFVSGGQSAFFSNFRFRFSDDELVFMRHAPRSFVQMGNNNWFDQHGFEAAPAHTESGWQLEIRSNKARPSFSFMEPVWLELKLKNIAEQPQLLDADLLQDGQHFSLVIQREGGVAKFWRPMITRCHQAHQDAIAAGSAIYGSHNISCTSSGWLIDEPGFYQVQAAIDLGHAVVRSNLLRIYVVASGSAEEHQLAPDYFTEDVGRVLSFGGAPALTAATEVLQELEQSCPQSAAALHARWALNAPAIRAYKTLGYSKTGAGFSCSTPNSKAAERLRKLLTSDVQQVANSMGNIHYYAAVRELADCFRQADDKKAAKALLEQGVSTMKQRQVLPAVQADWNQQLKQLK